MFERDHQPVHGLHAPASPHKLARQPVQQLRMRGALAHIPKIAGCGHDAAAEVIMPQPVDHHSRRKRILRIRQPVGQRGSSACGILPSRRLNLRWSRLEYGQKPRLDFLKRSIVNTHGKNMGCRRRSIRIHHGYSHRKLTGMPLGKFLQLAFQLCVAFACLSLQAFRHLFRLRIHVRLGLVIHLPFDRRPLGVWFR